MNRLAYLDEYAAEAILTFRNRIWAAMITMALAALALTACGGSSGGTGASGGSTAGQSANGSGSGSTIVIKNFMFSPSRLTVAPGATITVHNEDQVTHTLTDKANPHLFSTGDVGPGQTKTVKVPAKAGSYVFICTIHQYMTGTLVVK